MTVTLLTVAAMMMHGNYEKIKLRQMAYPANVFTVSQQTITDESILTATTGHELLYHSSFCFSDSYTVGTYGKECTVQLIGLTNSINIGYLPNADGEGVFIPTLLAGRDFCEEEINGYESAVIITESTGKLFFGDEDALGKTIHLSSNMQDDKEFVVVGIIKDSYASANSYNEYTRSFDNEYTAHPTVGLYTTAANVDSDVNTVIFYTEPQYSLRAYSQSAKVQAAFPNSSIRDLIALDRTYENEIQEFMSGYAAVFAVIMVSEVLVLLLFIIFSMKERVKEIGIRKAVGATDSDITTQFLSENLIFSLFASTAGSAVGFMIYLLIQYHSEAGNTYIMCFISWKTLFLTFLFSFTLIILTSVIPGIIGKRIKIVDALRFE